MIGRRLAHYRLVERIGVGGMGEVYLADDTRLERQVAIKILHSDSPDERDRLLIEARAASALHHPNVAHVYEVGDADGVSFIAMEYVRGISLDARIGGVPLPANEIVGVAVQIADALLEAHRRGVTHRDLKPANIMITARGEAKILDFGLARIHRAASSERRLTEPGVMVGTIDYMSPEQALGSEADIRSDIFSFGVVLYEMATGRRPFAGQRLSDVLADLLHTPAEPVMSLNAAIPRELARVIEKCIAKAPAERYQSPQPLLADLQALQHESQRRAFVQQSGRRPFATSRRRWTWAVIAIAVLMVAAAAFALRHSLRPRDRIDSLAVMPIANPSNHPETEYLSDGLTESLINSMSHLEGLRVISRPTAFRYKGRAITPRQLSRELNVRAVLSGKLLRRGNLIEIQTELTDAATDSQIWGAHYTGSVSDLVHIERRITEQISEQLRHEFSPDERLRLARSSTSNPEAFELYLRGRHLLNERKTVAKAGRLFQQAIEKDPDYALAYAALAETYIIPAARKRGAAAEELYEKAKAAAGRALELDPSLVEVHTALADLKYSWEWDWPAAEAMFRKAIELDRDYAPAHHWYALFLAYTGRGQQAVPHISEARRLEPDAQIIEMSELRVHYYARNFGKAIELAREALQRDNSAHTPWLIMSLCHEQLGDYGNWARTREEYSLALGNGDYAEALREGFAAGGYPEANRRYLQVLERRAARGETRDPHSSFETHVRLGNYDEAMRWAEEMYHQRSHQVFRLSGDPLADPLRKRPDFIALMRRLRLPPGADA